MDETDIAACRCLEKMLCDMPNGGPWWELCVSGKDCAFYPLLSAILDGSTPAEQAAFCGLLWGDPVVATDFDSAACPTTPLPCASPIVSAMDPECLIGFCIGGNKYKLAEPADIGPTYVPFNLDGAAAPCPFFTDGDPLDFNGDQTNTYAGLSALLTAEYGCAVTVLPATDAANPCMACFPEDCPNIPTVIDLTTPPQQPCDEPIFEPPIPASICDPNGDPNTTGANSFFVDVIVPDGCGEQCWEWCHTKGGAPVGPGNFELNSFAVSGGVFESAPPGYILNGSATAAVPLTATQPVGTTNCIKIIATGSFTIEFRALQPGSQLCYDNSTVTSVSCDGGGGGGDDPTCTVRAGDAVSFCYQPAGPTPPPTGCTPDASWSPASLPYDGGTAPETCLLAVPVDIANFTGPASFTINGTLHSVAFGVVGPSGVEPIVGGGNFGGQCAPTSEVAVPTAAGTTSFTITTSNTPADGTYWVYTTAIDDGFDSIGEVVCG